MPRARHVEITFAQKLLRIKAAGLRTPQPEQPPNEADNIDTTIEQRVQRLMQLVNNRQQNTNNMLFFVMYDIENTKIRTQIAKYLIKKGCVRIQKSIYIAEMERKNFDDIAQTLQAVQQAYDNNDSILVVPISTDELRAMRIIGQEIDVTFVSGNRSTMFF